MNILPCSDVKPVFLYWLTNVMSSMLGHLGTIRQNSNLQSDWLLAVRSKLPVQLWRNYILHLQVVASGNIVTGGLVFMSSTQKTFSLAVSRDMVPAARMLVFCLLGTGEVLADSINFHVQGIRYDNVGWWLITAFLFIKEKPSGLQRKFQSIYLRKMFEGYRNNTVIKEGSQIILVPSAYHFSCC